MPALHALLLLFSLKRGSFFSFSISGGSLIDCPKYVQLSISDWNTREPGLGGTVFLISSSRKSMCREKGKGGWEAAMRRCAQRASGR